MGGRYGGILLPGGRQSGVLAGEVAVVGHEAEKVVGAEGEADESTGCHAKNEVAVGGGYIGETAKDENCHGDENKHEFEMAGAIVGGFTGHLGYGHGDAVD